MATIRTAIQVEDRLSKPIKAMHNMVSRMVNQLEAMHAASGQMMDISSVQLAQRELAKTAEQFNKVENEIRKADYALQNFSNNIRDGTIAVSGLLNKVKELVGKYFDFQVVGRVLLSNETNTTSRLINNDLQTTEQPFTQAMGSGSLQGEGLNAVLQTTSSGAQNTTNYLSVLIDKIREIGSSGKISADSIRNAVLGMAIDGILAKLSEIARSDPFKELMQNVTIAMEKLSSVVSSTLNFLIPDGSLKDSWSFIVPIISTVAAAMLVYESALLLVKAAEIASTIWTGLRTLAIGLLTATTWTSVSATSAATAAAWGLNAAIAANPIFILVIAIVILIGLFYLAVAAFNYFAGTSVSATGIIAGAFMVLGSLIYNRVAYMWNLWASFMEFFVNLSKNKTYSVNKLFYNLATNMLDLIISMISGWDGFATSFVNAIVDAVNLAIQAWNWFVNLLPENISSSVGLKMGTEYSHRESITSDLKGLRGVLDNWIGEAPDDYWEAPKMEFKDLGKSWDKGYDWGANLFKSGEEKSNNIKDDKIKNDIDNALALGDKLDKGNELGKKTADNTERATEGIKIMNEDLKYLRDIAEREAINRYTTAEIKVDMKNENRISSELDIDGIIDRFGQRVEEVSGMLAEGGSIEDV
ncbi:MAG: tape measure protein [Lysinibacillus fusiformis]|uniref:tape measure protein n=1 Tax=Lysinibacillus fusiformis TaxID=28031 RepID=UPI00124424C8|nr:tape measure protein [Lysinibacillus fusiformis]KAB0441626.1 phage tail tape measure protein [Lysinibacillus fusiformis]MCT6816973.1 tape measure protein [Lysinibacillus fusiformis]MCT6928323.1 tape measure protein [Lysinibacillus fusiformis]MCT6933568.1 tape measure protein [Lysinibacillus fusiformis]